MKNLSLFVWVSSSILFVLSTSFIPFDVSANPRVDEEPTSGKLILIPKLNSEHQAQSSFEALSVDSKVKINVKGLIAKVDVTQVFKNDSPYWVEGKYLFPLPDKSAVDAMELRVGERVIVGEIHEKQKAKKIYQRAKAQGKSASLVTQKRPNIFSNQVANIGPFESVSVKISYQQNVQFDLEKGFSIDFPLTMTRRYAPRQKKAALPVDISNIQNDGTGDRLGNKFLHGNSDYLPVYWPERQGENLNTASLVVNLETSYPLYPIESDSHSIVHRQLSETNHIISLDPNQQIADRDFKLNWKPIDQATPLASVSHEIYGSESFVNLVVSPPRMIKEEQRQPRELIFVIDTSGSMAGESIRQAKKGLIAGLNSLKTGDWFNIIEFNSQTHSLFSSAVPMDSNSINLALRFIQDLQAEGGTEMMPAIQKALSNSVKTSRVRQVVFLTDGAISNESQLFALIQSSLNNSRLFTVGIGSAPNRFFMQRAAKFGRGTYTYIAREKNAALIMADLFNQIERPVLTDIRVEWPALTVSQYPKQVTDLYHNQPLSVIAKLSDLTGKEIMVSGKVNDQPWQINLRLEQTNTQVELHKLWAREKIASVMDESTHGALSKPSTDLVTRLALKHHLVSRFTALVAVDKTPRAVSETLKRVDVPLNSPAGSAQSVSFPQTGFVYDKPFGFWSLLSMFFFCLYWGYRR